MKIYNTDGSLKTWFEEHKYILFDDIVEACENSLEEDDEQIVVASVHTLYGVTLFSLPMFDDIITSLRKCEHAYVKLEEYEKAARARDCLNKWVEKKIYTENS